MCGTYSTSLTHEGYAVESEREPGSVQIYPASALELVEDVRNTTNNRCPTVTKTDNGTYIIIGATVKQADYEERIASNETAIEIDADFLENAVFVENR